MDSFRKSQGISPFGIGAIVDFENKSLMMLGLDFWPSEIAENVRKQKMRESYAVYDERFTLNLSKLLKRKISYFMTPSESKDNSDKYKSIDEATHLSSMPFIRFPNWYSCPKCKAMKFIHSHERGLVPCDNNETRNNTDFRPCKKSFRPPILIPVRFIIASSEGHITNFPFRKWVHGPKDDCAQRMYLTSTTRAGLAGTVIECACKKRRSMANSMNFNNENIKKCFFYEKMPADMPWLNKLDQGPTEASFRVVQRGASSAYMPVVKSSVLIPPYTNAIHKYINDIRNWTNIKASLKLEVNKLINNEFHINEIIKSQIIVRIKLKIIILMKKNLLMKL